MFVISNDAKIYFLFLISKFFVLKTLKEFVYLFYYIRKVISFSLTMQRYSDFLKIPNFKC